MNYQHVHSRGPTPFITTAIWRCRETFSHCPDRWWQCQFAVALQWRYNELDGVSNHQPYDRLLKRLFRSRSKKASKLRVTGRCKGNSPMTGEFPAQRAGNAENVSIWWRHLGNTWSWIAFWGYGVSQDIKVCPKQPFCKRHVQMPFPYKKILCFLFKQHWSLSLSVKLGLSHHLF